MSGNGNHVAVGDSLDAGDQILIWDTEAGDWRRLPRSILLAYIQSGLTFPDAGAFTTQYASPSATGFSVTITSGTANIHLILTPTAGFAAGTLVLPASTVAADKQEVLVNCTQQVTALTVNGSGATVTGEPTSLGADDFFRLKYDKATNVWYRVG